MRALLWADNVSFRYAPGAPLVVDGVSVRLSAGAFVGILGPNGSGKTTLLRLLSGTRRPSSGRVLLDDRPLDQLSRRNVARQIAVVPQETELAFEYRAIEIVLMKQPPQLRDAVLKSNPGTVQLVGQDGAFTIVAIVAKDKAGQKDPAMPEVKEAISSTLKNRKEQLLRAAYLTKLRNDAVVVNELADQLVAAQGKPLAASKP